MALTERKRKGNNRRAKEHIDFVHTGPGTLAGRYMRMFWQPVYRAQDLPAGHAKPIRVMSEDFTLYRGESGKPYLVGSRCAHRGTQLSVGWVEGDCIRCMYHGWKYDGTGQCVEQPAEEPSYARKIQIRSYPTEEYLGLIFAYLEEGKAPLFPRYPDFEKEGVLEVLPLQVWPCNYFQRQENEGDAVHVPFVHRNTFSAAPRSGIPNIINKESEWGHTTITTWPSAAATVHQFGMPNIFHFRLRSPYAGVPYDERIQWKVPIDDGSSVEFRVRYLPITGEAAQRYRESRAAQLAKIGPSVPELGETVLAGKLRIEDVADQLEDKVLLLNLQDYVAQTGQGTIADRADEHLGRSDIAMITLRKIWRRELSALAKGRPLKKWAHSVGMVVKHPE